MNKTYDLKNIPDDFRIIFTQTLDQIARFGDAILLAKFSFLIDEVVFSVDLGDSTRNTNAARGRDLIYETFNNAREFVDEKAKKIQENQQEYIQSLFAQGLVYLETSLESFIKRLIATLIKFDKEILTRDSFREINIPKPESIKIEDTERNLYLAELVINKLDCRYKSGVDKFECYLDAFGLSGAFDKAHEKKILVLHNLRNCIVHNDSIADIRFCRQCDRTGYQVGDRIVITDDEFLAYESSVLAYISEIFYRLNKNLGAPEHFLEQLRKKIDERNEQRRA